MPMKRSSVSIGSALLFAAFIFAGAVPATLAQTRESEDKGSLPQDSEELSHITPQADRMLRVMSEYLKKASEFTFHAELRYDTVLDNGQKIEYGASVRVACRRPNRLHIEYRGDERNTRLVYDGRTFTLLDLDKNVYSVIDVPDNIDAAVDHLFDKIGSAVPIADMVYADPYRILTEFVIHGSFVGLHKIGGRPCHHLAFAQEQVDWQIWIEDGPRPLPRKLIVAYTDQEGSPQYAARFTHWDFQPRISDDYFQFHPPAGADQIEVLPMTYIVEEPESEATP